MSDLTTENNIAERQEQLTREYLDTLKPQIEQMVRALLAPGLEGLLGKIEAYDVFVRESEAQLRRDVARATQDYATKDEVEAKAQEFAAAQFAPLQSGFQSLIADFNQERERSQHLLDQRVEQMLTLAQAAETRSVENEKAIAEMKGTYEERFGQIDKQIATIRRDIDTSVKSVSASAKRMDESTKRIDEKLALFFEKADKRIDKIELNASTTARDVLSAVKKIGDLEDRRSDDAKEVRRVESIVNTESRIVRDIEQRVILDMTRMNTALYGDDKEKEPGMVADMRTLKGGLWWQAWIGSHPYKAILIAGALYVLFLIVTAFVLNRPEIIARMIPLGSSNAN